MPGSSPLARGLPGDVYSATSNGRIIPARAGFTHTPKTWRATRKDHPRSRGVYLSGHRGVQFRGGSSPLARGLRAILALGISGWRIIPARAGFTGAHASHTDTTKDHPRSRGVYYIPLQSTWRGVGSSPLARGLLSGRSTMGFQRRIIPARAGFTRATRSMRSTMRDHPRSRGVYGLGGLTVFSLSGSSPLARGLLLRPPRRPTRRRIIPARAGFTRH